MPALRQPGHHCNTPGSVYLWGKGIPDWRSHSRQPRRRAGYRGVEGLDIRQRPPHQENQVHLQHAGKRNWSLSAGQVRYQTQRNAGQGWNLLPQARLAALNPYPVTFNEAGSARILTRQQPCPHQPSRSESRFAPATWWRERRGSAETNKEAAPGKRLMVPWAAVLTHPGTAPLTNKGNPQRWPSESQIYPPSPPEATDYPRRLSAARPLGGRSADRPGRVDEPKARGYWPLAGYEGSAGLAPRHW